MLEVIGALALVGAAIIGMALAAGLIKIHVIVKDNEK